MYSTRELREGLAPERVTGRCVARKGEGGGQKGVTRWAAGRRRWSDRCGGAAWGLLLLAVTLPALADDQARGPIELPASLADAMSQGPPKTVEQLRDLQNQVRRVVDAALPVTVAVELDNSVGSGVIVSGDGLVLTAGHVSVEPNREVVVRFPDGRRVKGRSLGVNHDLDSGLVRISDAPSTSDGESLDAWPHVPVSDRKLELGEWVVGLGQPNGFVPGRAPPVRLGRLLSIEGKALNTDVTLVGGDSGGPLLNLRAEVVGIHSKIGEQITSNYHVPVAAYSDEWERLIDGRMTGVPEGEDPSDWRPMVGVAFREVGGELVVTQVFPGRAAEEAGVETGDVLLALAGREVGADQASLMSAIMRLEPFERTKLTVRRGKEELALDLWLGRGPANFPGTLGSGEGR